MAIPQKSDRTRTQAERREESERRLLEAALDLFAQHGIAGTTSAQIGAKAGYSRGLVTERFGSKMGLVRALVAHIRVVFDVKGSQEGDDSQALLAFYDSYLDGLSSDEPTSRAVFMLFAESVTGPGEIRTLMAELSESVRADLRRRLQSAKDNGELRADADPAALATVLLGLARGVALQWLVDPETVDLVSAKATGRAMLESYMFDGPTRAEE